MSTTLANIYPQYYVCIMSIFTPFPLRPPTLTRITGSGSGENSYSQHIVVYQTVECWLLYGVYVAAFTVTEGCAVDILLMYR